MSKLLSINMSFTSTAYCTASAACCKGAFTTVQVDKLEEAGVKKVVCLAVAEPEEVSEWADKVGLTGTKIEVWADTKGAWTRMLGLDENQYDAPGPRSQRYNVSGLQYTRTLAGCTQGYSQAPFDWRVLPAQFGRVHNASIWCI
jgi:hypothetical protein